MTGPPQHRPDDDPGLAEPGPARRAATRRAAGHAGARRRGGRAGGRRRGDGVDRRLDGGRGRRHRGDQPRVPRGRPQRGPRPGAGAAAVGGPTAGGPGAAAPAPGTTAAPSPPAGSPARARVARRRPRPRGADVPQRERGAVVDAVAVLEGGHGVEHPGDERARIGGRGRDQVEQPLLAEPPGRARGVGQAVGEEQQCVAAAQRAGHLGALRAGHGAQQQAVTADRLDRAGRLDAERQRVAAGGQRHGDAVGGLAQYRADHGHERELVPLAQGLVDDVEHGGGLAVVAGGRLGRMAHERRQRGGLDPLAGDVAHEDHQAAVDREDVVEVAADLGLRDARAVHRRELPALRRGQAVGQQAGLERLGAIVGAGPLGLGLDARRHGLPAGRVGTAAGPGLLLARPGAEHRERPGEGHEHHPHDVVGAEEEAVPGAAGDGQGQREDGDGEHLPRPRDRGERQRGQHVRRREDDRRARDDVDDDQRQVEADRQDDRPGGRGPAAPGTHLRAGAAWVAARRWHRRQPSHAPAPRTTPGARGG